MKRPANVMKPPSMGKRVLISIKQLLAQKMTDDQMRMPIRSPRGPAAVRGPPMETKRPAPVLRQPIPNREQVRYPVQHRHPR